MIHWIETHGVETILFYLFFGALVGSMPPLPDGSGYYRRWIYGFLHMAAMNLREGMKLLNLTTPQITEKPEEKQP